MMENSTEVPAHSTEDLTLSYARTLSWLSLLIILLTNIGLSITISNSAHETLLTKQKNFAGLLTDNLNHQIYRRFTVPTVMAYGRIALRWPAQYERLDQVVKSVIHSLPVKRIRIYDYNRVIAYSTDTSELGRTGRASPCVDTVLRGGYASSEIVSTIPAWQAPFRVPLQPGTFVLRTVCPLSSERTLNTDGNKHPLMGVMELEQDITDDYESVLAFQGLIVVICLLSSFVLFALLQIVIRRTKHVLAERMGKMRELENELHSTEKWASMGRVVAGIAHEIRNPLGIIRSSAELLLKRSNGGDQRSQCILSAIYDESFRLSRTVNDFLDYARPRQPKQEAVDINLVLTQVLAFLEGEFSRCGISVERSSEDSLPCIWGDKDLLYRAFYNILSNGQQAMDGPGHISLHLRDTGQKQVEVSIQDSGPGFPPDSIANLTEPFYTTKDGGTGLGLAIVKNIIEAHGGSLVLENAPAGGALVRVLLPIAPEETAKEEHHE